MKTDALKEAAKFTAIPAVCRDESTARVWVPMSFYTGWDLHRLEVDIDAIMEYVYVPNNYLLITQT